jgi:hypothetical protein
MKRLMAATAIGLAVGGGTTRADAATLGPQRTGETETYRLTSTETSARGTWMTSATFRVTRVDARTLEIADTRDPRNVLRVDRLRNGEVAPRPGPLGDFIYAYNQTVAALDAATAHRTSPLPWRVGPPGATIPATVRIESDGTAVAVSGSGPLEGGPPPPHVSVELAIRVAAERVTSAHSEEQLELDAPRPLRIAHSWSLEAVGAA